MAPLLLTDADRAQLAALGISEAEVERQIRLFRNPPPCVKLVRPCRVGDGVHRLPEDEHEALGRLHDEAARTGRLSKLVPASGAASRMFQSLARYLSEDVSTPWEEVRARAAAGEKPAGEVVRFVEGLRKLPFREELRRAAGEEAWAAPGPSFRTLIRALVSGEGLGYAELPKALIPFHEEEEGTRTPFEEHLVEAGLTVRDGSGRCRVHFTVPEASRGAFEELLSRHGRRLEERLHARFDVSFSVQERATDTVAVDLDDSPFRSDDGTILFRPGGHGALLANLGRLAELGADLVYLKNVDNVVPDARKGPTLLWKRLLAGHLVRLERHVGRLREELARAPFDPAVAGEAESLLTQELGVPEAAGLPPAGRAERLRDLLDRPLRVCGVVRNQGEPGGGPFWVEDSSGRVSPQIVEGSQVDRSSESQRLIWESSTHFNPVDLVLKLRGAGGKPYDLERYVDQETVFVSRKSKDGRELKALERPGLWNGAMAGWLTVFVEVPIETFAPVKTVLDLLRPEHQPG